MANKVEIDVELLSDLVEAASFVSTFNNMFHNGETFDNCGDLDATEYLASKAASIEQRGRVVLEAAEQSVNTDEPLVYRNSAGVVFCKVCGTGLDVV